MFWSTIKETPGQPKESIVFTEGTTFTIDAPASLVYDIIIDFQQYSAWNTWSPEFKFDDKQEIHVGSRGLLLAKALLRDYELPVQIVKLADTSQEKVLGFRGLLMPSWFAVVERVHTVVPGADGSICEVTSWESMGGWGAYLLKYFLKAREQVQDANKKFARDLKLFAETKT